MGEGFSFPFFISPQSFFDIFCFHPRCLEKVIIHLLHSRDLPKSASVCFDKFDSFMGLVGFGWIALCCTSTEVAMFRFSGGWVAMQNIAERQVSFRTSEGAADLWQVLGILASPCDKLDFMEDRR